MRRTSPACARGCTGRFLVVVAIVAVIALAAESASASSPRTWINTSGCASPGFGLVWAQHPTRIGVTCDPHDQIVRARWRNWGQAKARATAKLVVDNCNPNCAAGRIRRYAITLVASKIRHCGARRVYGRVVFYRQVAGRQKMYSVPAEGFC